MDGLDGRRDFLSKQVAKMRNQGRQSGQTRTMGDKLEEAKRVWCESRLVRGGEEMPGTTVAYTKEDIKAAWLKYESADVMSMLKSGEWEHTVLKAGEPSPKPEGTRAQIQKALKVMGFPEFLEKHWKV